MALLAATASPLSNHQQSPLPPLPPRHTTQAQPPPHVPIPFTPLDELLLAPHETPLTAPAALDRHHHFDFEDPLDDLYSLSVEPGTRVKVLPPTADRLAKLDAAYERVMGGSSGHGSTPLLDSHLSMGLDEEISSSMIRSVRQMTIEEATSVLSAIDRRLNIIGLKSQREKAAFLTSIGASGCFQACLFLADALACLSTCLACMHTHLERVAIGARISQQHYSTLLKAIKEQRWTGGVRASYTVRKLQAAVLDPSEVSLQTGLA